MSSAASKTTEQAAQDALATAAGSAQVGATSAPMPELNGLILQLPGAAPLYLVLNAYRCWIPDPQTLQNLFIPGATITPSINIGVVSEGAALTSGAVLVQGDASPQVYLVSNGVKMWIPDEATLNRYQFSKAQIQIVPQVVIDFLPNGPNVQEPTS
ncbi:MAG TPA: hypothetical protein VJS17_11455 [Pyrinomonadaceae bacterium]|nr:hypothetical protein [Pyrinomonadaceae bacterium]